jgi:hypothetical protein
MKTSFCVALVLGVFIAGLVVSGETVSAPRPPQTAKIYDMRVYKANPGKLNALNARFRDHTCRIFTKHGMKLIGFWTPSEGADAKDTLIYIVAFPNLEAQKKAWKSFWDDPEWKKVKADSEKDGVLVKEMKSTLLRATDYSPIR